MLLGHHDWEQPYALDLARIYAQCLARGRYADDVSLGQERALAMIPYLVIASEAQRTLEKAAAARDWDAVETTLHHLGDIQTESRNLVYAQIEQSVGQGKKFQQFGKQGGRPALTRAEITGAYDKLAAQGHPRSRIIARLARLCDAERATVNRILRASGRGAPRKKAHQAQKSAP
jgi:hypothetical protein